MTPIFSNEQKAPRAAWRRRNGHPHAGQPAFALVIVLVILSLLAVVSVGYLSSMANERGVAAAFANKTRAEQAAQAGVDTAIATLRECFRAYPDSATVWETQSKTAGSSDPTEGTSLYVRALPDANNANSPATDPNADNRPPHDTANPNAADPRKIFVLPLSSGATFQPIAAKDNAVNGGAALSLTDDKSVDLNLRRKQGDTQGFIGTPSDYSTTSNAPKPVRVPWVEVKQQGVANAAKAPTIARYAFWVEDESFRTNISFAGLGAAGGHQRIDNANNLSAGGDPQKKSSLDPTDVDLLGTLRALGGAAPQADAQKIYDVRLLFPANVFPESRAFAHADGLNFPHYADIYADASLTSDQRDQKALARYGDQIAYYTTTRSAALNLSRHGSQRLNLNEVVSAKHSAQTQVDAIVNTMRYHAPSFGQRFYRTSDAITPANLNALQVTGDSNHPDHAKIYFYKIAANIIDYIDADSVPTFISDDGTPGTEPKVRNNVHPEAPFMDVGQRNNVWAIGKDAAPFMQEAAARFTGNISQDGRHYTLNTDYYIEMWNMSNRDINPGDLGPNAYIRIRNPQQWVGTNSKAGGSAKAYDLAERLLVSDDADGITLNDSRTKRLRDFDIDISKVSFPAGAATVITTDPNYTDIITDAEAQRHVARADFLPTPKGKRTYNGTLPTGCDSIKISFSDDPDAPTNGSSDYYTEVIIGSDAGYIDNLIGALAISRGSSQIAIPYNGSYNGFKVYGGQPRGNWTNTSNAPNEGKQACATGDPRSINEQLVYTPVSYSDTANRSRFNVYEVSSVVHPTLGNPATLGLQTLGLPNYRNVRPNRPENPWPDFQPYYAQPSTNTGPTAAELVLNAANAPAVIANAPLTSIGQLGDVYDPARIIYNGLVNYSHGGGRSLKIGQHDDRWDGDETSASRAWASWRLADMFCVNNAISQEGLINVNGVARDNGAALKAALTGFKFQPPTPATTKASGDAQAPTGDPKLDDSAASSEKLQADKIVQQMKARLAAAPTANGQPNTGTAQTGVGPFWERGELSELPGFGRTPNANPATTYATTDFTGVDMSKAVFDRGREEVLRRLIEMTTTRGDVFTVYAVGQAITQTNPGLPTSKRFVNGSHQMKVTFRLVPKAKLKTGQTAADDFHPGTDNQGNYQEFDPKKDSAQFADRFDKPDHYDIQILSVSAGGG